MTKKIVVVILASLLASCSLVPAAPPTPTPIDIATEAALIAGINASPTDYLSTGVELSNNACGAYFNSLTNQAANLGFASQETTLAGGVASGLAGLSGASTAVVAGMGIVFPAVSQSLTNAARAATGGIAPPAVWPMIQKSQSAYLSAVPAPATKTEAAMYVSGYAQLCQPATVNALVLESQINAQPSVVGPPAASLRLAPSGIRPPPVVTVGR